MWGRWWKRLKIVTIDNKKIILEYLVVHDIIYIFIEFKSTGDQ